MVFLFLHTLTYDHTHTAFGFSSFTFVFTFWVLVHVWHVYDMFFQHMEKPDWLDGENEGLL